MSTPTLTELADLPIVVAPMGGGPSTPALVTAASRAGAIGFLAAGYKSVEQMTDEVRAVRAATSGPFGVNLFVPGEPTRDRHGLDAYIATLTVEATELGVDLGDPAWDDDGWVAKCEAVVALEPPVVSFTFGCPPPGLAAALRSRGTVVAVTVTSPAEASQALASGADVLCLQGVEAGAHRGTFQDGPVDPGWTVHDLVRAVRVMTDVPLLAAGGIARAADVAAAIRAGAEFVQVGTAFLRADESGTHPVHRDALVDPTFTSTAFTRSFSGRRARGLLNDFMTRHADAPNAYPEINNLTRPLRAAAAARGDRSRMSLWAGVGHRHARAAPAAAIIADLVGRL